MKKNRLTAIIGGMVLIISLLSGVWLVDDRYVSATELQQAKKQIYLRLDTSEYRILTEQYYKFKMLVGQHPDDVVLRQQFKKICEERESVKKRIDESLRD